MRVLLYSVIGEVIYHINLHNGKEVGVTVSSRVDVLYAEVIDFVEKMVDPEKVDRAKRWHKESVVSYGFDKSDMKKVNSKFDGHFYELSLEEGIALAGKFIRSGNSTLIHIRIHLLGLRRKELDPAHFRFFDEFVDSFVGWGNVDHFCSVLQSLLARHPADVIGLLRKWNRSDNRWKRRASVVVFTRSVAKEGRFIDEALDLCEKLIWDEEDLVRKGVGWALKDNMRADKERVLKYVKSLRRRGVSSVITLYAIRDLKGEERKEVLSIKNERQP
jgi:3-methyladenine DNA glycosylase AlkD